jgi:hypothetical protein
VDLKPFRHALATNTSLKTLRLCTNYIDDTAAFAEGLEKNQCLEHLELGWNLIENVRTRRVRVRVKVRVRIWVRIRVWV